MSDEISKSLSQLKGELLIGRKNLSEKELREVILRVGGPKTARAIIKAKKDFPLQRIPFLFSAVDTQAVVDILCNDLTAVLKAWDKDKK
jgi:hypothetical protein